MNILVLNWRDMKHPEAGGAEVHFQEIFGRLVARGHGVDLLCTRFKGCAPSDSQNGIAVHRLGHTFTFNWEAPFLVRKLMGRRNFDCIIDDVNKIPFFSPRWFPKTPVGAFFHHFFGDTVYELAARPMAEYVRFMENLSAWGYRSVPACTVSDSTRREMVHRGFCEEAITVIENSVDTELFFSDSSVQKEDNLLLYTGRIKRYKNIGIVLDAMALLKKRGFDLRFMVAGSGDDLAALREKTAVMNLEGSVSFLGYVNDDEKISLYRRATLFINPSRKEGWGITNIEANACGTAVVANNVPGLQDSVQDGKTGLLYRENDPEALADAIASLLVDGARRQAMETQGRRWAQLFSWDNSALRVERWIEEKIIGKPFETPE